MKPGLAILAALALFPPAAFAIGEPFLLVNATRVVILALAALSLDLILGYGGLVSFGHAAFLGIGAYAVAMLASAGIDDLLLQLAAAILAAASFAFVTGAISLRTSGVYFIMITLAFGQMMFFLMVSLSPFGGDNGMSLPSRSMLFGHPVLGSDTGLYYVSLIALALTFLVLHRVVLSRFGRVLHGSRDNPVRMQAIGFAPFRYRLAAYVMAGSIAGAAGVLLANQAEFVSPAYMTWQRSGELIVMVVLGGQGTLTGAIGGAIVFLLLEDGLAQLSDHWRLGLGALLVLMVLFGRGGLAGLARRVAPRMTALETRNLRKAYGAFVATDDVSLSVGTGELHAIIGPNGAGKTTLIHQLSGALFSDAGSIHFAGADITRMAMVGRVRLGLARSFQVTSVLEGFSVLENAALAVQARAGSSFRFFGRVAAEAALNRAAMDALARVGLDDRAGRRADTLSHGEKRQLEIAIALATDARVLLLDEPLAGTGPEESAMLIALLRRLKATHTIVLIEHDMEAVFALADRVSVLVYGRIIASGAPACVRNDPAVREAYLGEEEAA